MGADKDGQNLVPDSADCYGQNHGNTEGLLRQDEGQPASRSEGAGTFGIPDIGQLKDLNRRIHEDDGKPERFALDQPAPVLGCLEAANEAFDPSPEGVVKTAAVLAHGIAQAQSFRDGNRRTAYFTTQSFLASHDLGYISAAEDDMLTRKLNQIVVRQSRRIGLRPPTAEDIEKLFLRRLDKRKPPGS